MYNRILLSHKRNAFESVLMRWMNLEPMIQSEVSQKRSEVNWSRLVVSDSLRPHESQHARLPWLLSYKKERIWVISNEVDETGVYYTE